MYTDYFLCNGKMNQQQRKTIALLTIVGTEDNAVVSNDCGYLGVGRPGSMPFVRMAVYCWPFMCGGRRDCWCPLIGSDL